MMKRLDELSARSWSRSIALNQTGVFFGMREAVGVIDGDGPMAAASNF